MVLGHGSDHDVLFIEGQGSLLHPSSTATLPLIRGAQPTHVILVHRAGQTHLRLAPQVKIPGLKAVIQLYETVAEAGGVYGPVAVIGVALNTFHLAETEARGAIAAVTAETGLPCTDVVRFGGEALLAQVLASPQ
jgi:uncharacterized NAD-dependent epimerase/dehydratase family protein